MKISSEFSKYATSYGRYNLIQDKVADKLLSLVKNRPQYILDLGCGSGALVKKIQWPYKKFVGVDFASGMLALHPQSEKIECLYGDFNDKKLFAKLQSYPFDYILSASALQWAEDIETLFKEIAALQKSFALAIFTANTFKTLYKTTKLDPILPSKEKLYTIGEKYLGCHFEVVEYRLEFENVREMLRYIKRSGVSGSRNVLNYKEMKQLMQNYPLNYLEFEVAFLSS